MGALLLCNHNPRKLVSSILVNVRSKELGNQFWEAKYHRTAWFLVEGNILKIETLWAKLMG